MSTIESIVASASELSVDDRLTIAMQLLELVRDTLDGGKAKKGKKSKKSKKSESSSDSESVTEKKTREPTKWTTGLAAIRPILEKNGINKKLAMKIGSKLKDLPSWPAPSEKEVVAASKEIEAEADV
jgi:hypothetical protein